MRIDIFLSSKQQSKYLFLVLILGLTACRQNTVVSNSSSIGVTVQPSGTAGVPFALTVSIRDSKQNLNGGFTGVVQFSSSDPNASFPAVYTFVPSDHGSHTFTSLTFKTAGTQKIFVSSPQIKSGDPLSVSKNVNVSAGPGTRIVFSSHPTTTITAGTAMISPLSAQILDEFGNLASSGSLPLSLSAYSDPTCSTQLMAGLSSSSGLNVSPVVFSLAGTASFTQIGFNKSGDIFMGVSSPGLSVACSSAVHVLPGAANRLSFLNTLSSQAVAGAAFAVQPRIGVLDAFDNIMSSSSAPVTIAAFSDSACQVPASSNLMSTAATINASMGVANFSGISNQTAGTLYLRASSPGLTSVCSSTITVLPASANRISYLTQPSISGVAGQMLLVQPMLKVSDAFGNLAAGFSNVITLSAFSDLNCTLPAAGVLSGGVVSATAGVASFSSVNYTKAETIFLGASSNGLIGACSSAIAVSAASASKLAYSVQPSSNTAAGSTWALQPKVVALDKFGNTDLSFTEAVFAAPFTDIGCKVIATGAFQTNKNPVSAISGSAQFAGTSYLKAETIFLLASTSGLTSVCSAAVQVLPSAASKIVVINQPSMTGLSGVALAAQPKFAIQDAFGNLVTSAAFPILLSAFADSTCKIAASGSLAATSNPLTSVSGTAGFAGVRYSSVGTIFLGAGTGSLVSACSNPISISSVTGGGSATLNWDAGTEAALAGYKVYYGTASGAYGPPVDAGKNTTYTISGLSSGKTYFFSITAYDAMGTESPRSNEVSKVIP
ncbi:MAG: fibronectin type III domain-containing protein [Bdellovibrionota bacterium]